tara:strand:- start:872 stop:1333 length:462 start_codon:yes stop_codon:yes gene_type:complete
MTSKDKINLLIEISEADRKHVMLYVAFCFAIPAIVVSDIDPTGLSAPMGWLLIVATVALFVAGASFFRYGQAISHARISAIGEIMSDSVEGVRNTLFGVTEKHGRRVSIWADNKSYFYIGQALLWLGIGAFSAFFIWRINLETGVNLGLCPCP